MAWLLYWKTKILNLHGFDLSNEDSQDILWIKLQWGNSVVTYTVDSLILYISQIWIYIEYSIFDIHYQIN